LLVTLLDDRFTPIEWHEYTPYNLLPPREALKQHTQITLDGGTLDRYSGRYATAGATLTVTREGSRLFFAENDSPRVEIFAETENHFFTKVSDDEFSFEGDAGGKSTTMIVHADGQTVPLKRVQ
jgi:hypothetical protein